MDPLPALQRMNNAYIATTARRDAAAEAYEFAERRARAAAAALFATVQMVVASGATWDEVAAGLGLEDENAARMFCLMLRHQLPSLESLASEDPGRGIADRVADDQPDPAA